jgi:hypothetical protein
MNREILNRLDDALIAHKEACRVFAKLVKDAHKEAARPEPNKDKCK